MANSALAVVGKDTADQRGTAEACSDGNESYDVVVVGSGAGGLATALSAAIEGLRVIVLEKAEQFGGTTSRSGGAAWLPGNPLAREVGIVDEGPQVRTYLQTATGKYFEPSKVDAFLNAIPAMVRELHEKTEVRLSVSTSNPDYHPTYPGARVGGRQCYPVPYDGRQLGSKLSQLRPGIREWMPWGMYIAGTEIGHFEKGIASVRSTLFIASRIFSHFVDIAINGRATRLTSGAALVARLAKSLFDRNVEIRTSSPVTGLLLNNGTVSGVEAGGKTIFARRGVVLACGGFPHDLARRKRLYPKGGDQPDYLTPTPPENTGDGLALAEGAGGIVTGHLIDVASWAPVSRVVRNDGSVGAFPHVRDRQKPGVIAVTREGKRFCNDSSSYHDFVKEMAKACDDATVVVYLIADHRSVRRYGFGNAWPRPMRLRRHLRSGYLMRGSTIAELAGRIGIDAMSLERTVQEFNRHAELGEDPIFHRGASAYDRYLGDPTHKPNPCIAPLKRSPFYAIRVERGEIGTFAGVKTNEHAQVMHEKGSPIAGLYAVGNDMASVFAGDYVGGGATLGPALAFGFIAGKHLAGSAPRQDR
jgi:succinate dehydrogenase/fumarate reductase flavoprotein subunit